MSKVTVTGSIVSKTSITLFLADGASMVLPQDAWKTQEISEYVLPALMTSQGAGVEIDLDAYSIATKLAAVTGLSVSDNDNGGVNIKIGDKVVSDENLTMHVERALAGEGAKGFGNFMKKFAEIKRKHTADELLHFLKQADMPFADDGSILAYKALRLVSKDDNTGVETMVDKHSGKVLQKLGSLVYMPDSKVDDNRSRLCSTGLHIAAKSYLGGHWGGSTNERVCIVKIQPKDVIAVPHGESKMRVAAYHIIKVLGKESSEVANGKSIFDFPSSHKALEQAVGGSHTPVLETVKVTGLGQIEIKVLDVKAERVERKAKKKSATVTRIDAKKPKVDLPKVLPQDINILKKLTKHSDLSKFDKGHIKKLVRAQKLLDKGESLRFIAGKIGLDRDSLSLRLVKKKAA